MKLATITEVSNLPHAPVPETKGKVEKVGGKRFGYNYIFIKSYKESQKNDVVKCLYIKSLTNFGFCVIKEGSHGDTKDKDGRDIIDRLKWQRQLHEQLQDKIRMPRFLDAFEENGNYYLVIEHIKGKTFYKACAEESKELRQAVITGTKLGMQFLDYLMQITDILKILHAQGIVHRDATANNFMITPDGKVAVIDMEMCYSLKLQYPLPAFQLGTHGYMSPQQLATEVPTTAEDIFALGAIILQLWSNVSASKLTNDPIEQLVPKVRFFIPDKQLADLVIQCLQPIPENRPDIHAIWRILLQHKNDLKYKIKRAENIPVLFSREEIITTIQQTINTLATPLLVDEKRGWFSDKMDEASEADKNKLNRTWYASYNRGVTGVIYMLAQAKIAGLNIEVTSPFIEKGLDLIKAKYIDRSKKSFAGSHFGADGIAAVLSVSIRAGLIKAEPEYLTWIDFLLDKQSDSMGIIDGVAGQGLANMVCRLFVNPSKMQRRLEGYAQLLLDKQEKNGSWVHGFIKRKYIKGKKKKVIRGFGDGMAGIIFFLLMLAKQYDNKDAHEMAILGLRWLMKQATPKKNIMLWNLTSKKELNYRWEQGTAGIALTFIKAYEITGESIYKRIATSTLLGISPSFTDTNVSQLHGLSGLGEVYLEAHRVFKEDEWNHRAGWIVQVIMQLKKIHPQYGPYWLVEHERQPVANFMVGNGGVMHFLLRYCCPDKIGYPLMP